MKPLLPFLRHIEYTTSQLTTLNIILSLSTRNKTTLIWIYYFHYNTSQPTSNYLSQQFINHITQTTLAQITPYVSAPLHALKHDSQKTHVKISYTCT